MPATERLANRDLDSSVLEPLTDPPARAHVVVVGGGIVGASIAYHLTQLGLADVVVLERHRLTSGTSWHAAGLVAQARSTHALTELSRTNVELYATLPETTGVETGFRRVGALTVARTDARFQELLSGVSVARDAGLDARILSADEAAELWPPMTVEDVAGATFFPGDGTVNPGDAALAMAVGAHRAGARFVHRTTVRGFRRHGHAVTGVEIDGGHIDAEFVVLATGLWTSELARLAGASVPLYPAEHVWVRTEPALGATEDLPILRDLDGSFYVRHYAGAFLVGAFEPRGKPKPPWDVPVDGFAEFGEDWDHLAPVLGLARERVPELREIGFAHFLRAPESFTPDSNFHLGPLPEVEGLWVAAGFNSQGVIYAPGAGRALAAWIVEGRPTMDLTEVDVARAGRWSNNRAWLHAKTSESLGRLYALHWPALQSDVGRGVRRTPLYDRQRARGAAFGDAAGWDRPAWFEPDVVDPPWAYDFDRPSWFGPVAEEVLATRRGVALFDLSTYAKFLVQGPGAVDALQRLCASDVDVEPGRVVYTTICNDRGGIELDPTVTRLAHDIFFVVAPTAAQRRAEALLRGGLVEGATVTDVTSAFAILHVAGPRARDVLEPFTGLDLSDEGFPFLAARRIDAGWAQPWALRLSYTGEVGWELYVPTEFAVDLYEKLVGAGQPAGMRHAGAFAFDALRLERGFRSWGHDVGPLDDPYAAGLGFTVDLAKEPSFTGREVLAKLRAAPPLRRLVSILLADPAPMLWHGESVLRNGERVGHVTSGAYGPTFGASVGLAWVHATEPIDGGWVAAGTWTVEIRTREVAARVSVRPFPLPDA
jgi:4-methylaminobutanoate oxidase (formaldehyde-forming)